MAKNTGLGRGLDALFSTPLIEEKEEIVVENKGGITKLSLNEIEPNRNQARQIFDDESIEELSNSIKEYGLIQPIVVTPKSNYYEIVAGERRWRAAKKAGLKEIPVVIREDDRKTNQVISLIENVQREDLNPIEKARGIKSLMDEHGLTQQQVADKLGKSRSCIANTVRILNLDKRVINLALEGKLSEGHCRALMSIEDPNRQYIMAQYIIEGGDSVREAERKTMTSKKTPKKEESKYLPIYKEIETRFQGFFGTKVKLDPGVRSGKIVIRYDSNEDLERIMDLLK